MLKRPFVFADRDGTLIHDTGYAFRTSDYTRLPGAAEGLRLLQDAGFGIAVVTNQSGIARGYYTEADYRAFQEQVERDFAAAGVQIEASFFCPHLPDEGCACRKPATGLLRRAETELGADLARSWVIGDNPSDMRLAQSAGCRGLYVLTGHGAERRTQLRPELPVAADLLEAARHILAH